MRLVQVRLQLIDKKVYLPVDESGDGSIVGFCGAWGIAEQSAFPLTTLRRMLSQTKEVYVYGI